MVKMKIAILQMLCIIFLVFCNCTNDYSKNIGSGYTYRNEGGSIKDISHKYPTKGGEIPSTVVSFDYDNEFIIAKQKPKLPQDVLYSKKYSYDEGDTVFYYWLIIKKEHKVFGPLSIEQFSEMKKEYNVSAELNLE